MLDVGEEVRVFDVNGPSEGWPGEVVKVGSALATIRYKGRESKFRLDTSRLAGGAYAHQTRFLTLAQVKDKRRRESARAILREYGVEVGRATLSTMQLEAIAEIVRDGVQ